MSTPIQVLAHALTSSDHTCYQFMRVKEPRRGRATTGTVVGVEKYCCGEDEDPACLRAD